MNKAQLIHICGDLHGEWDKLNTFINKTIKQSKAMRTLAATYDELEVVILQCGDFGYWPQPSPLPGYLCTGTRKDHWGDCGIKNQVDFIKDGLVKIYWCDGNHENHDALDALEAAHPGEPFITIIPGVYFATFGSMLRLLDGTNTLFCGGAESARLDIRDRIPGISWWPQEGIDDADTASLPDPKNTRVDWVISHTGPHSFETVGKEIDHSKNRQPSKDHLERILEKYHLKRWWFGHYHQLREGHTKGCRWVLLDRINNPIGRKWVDTVLLTKKE